MIEVHFHEKIDDSKLRFAVIVSRSGGKWVFVKHRERLTWECPGGHRESGETIFAAASRELWEETGALDYSIKPVSIYSVIDDSGETFGMLYFAEIFRFGELPALEIETVSLFDEPPAEWTYPFIQPALLERVRMRIREV